MKKDINTYESNIDLMLNLKFAFLSKQEKAHYQGFIDYLANELEFEKTLVQCCFHDLDMKDFVKNPHDYRVNEHNFAVHNESFKDYVGSSTGRTARHIKDNFQSVVERFEIEANEIEPELSLPEYLFKYQGNNNFTLKQITDVLAGYHTDINKTDFFKQFALNYAHLILQCYSWWDNEKEEFLI